MELYTLCLLDWKQGLVAWATIPNMFSPDKDARVISWTTMN